MTARLQDRVALVTGAASGIGKAIVAAFATEGAKVVGADMADIQDATGLSLSLKLNVTVAKEWEKAVAETVQKFGRLDILVNCAGVGLPLAPIWDMDEAGWEFSIAVNSTGVALGCKYGAKQMIAQEPLPGGDRGRIVNIASILGQVGSLGLTPYVASKHACVGITRAAALDCAPYKVHVNAICPGWIETALTAPAFANDAYHKGLEAAHPFGGTGRVEDVAKAVLFLSSPDNTWMCGSLMTVDGGYTAR